MGTTMKEVREALKACGLPYEDRYDLPTSEKRFPDGAHYRHEISGVYTVKQMEGVAERCMALKQPVHRVIFGSASECTRSELRDLAQISNEAGIELIVSPGISPLTGMGRHTITTHGQRSGWRVRGVSGLASQVASVFRCVEEGLRGFLLFGEDSCQVLSQLKELGRLPQDVVLKVSYTAGHANPAGARLLEKVGASSFNPITDLELPMLAALRQTISIPMDIVVFGWPSLGSINRLYHTPSIVRVSAPCYLKQELDGDPAEKVKNCEVIEEVIRAEEPELRVSGVKPADLSLAKVSKG